MEKPLSEEIVDSILANDKESFMAAFNAALTAKVTDALEVKKVEIASTLITPEVAVEEEIDLDESKGEMDDEDEDEDEDSEDMKEEVEQGVAEEVEQLNEYKEHIQGILDHLNKNGSSMPSSEFRTMKRHLQNLQDVFDKKKDTAAKRERGIKKHHVIEPRSVNGRDSHVVTNNDGHTLRIMSTAYTTKVLTKSGKEIDYGSDGISTIIAKHGKGAYAKYFKEEVEQVEEAVRLFHPGKMAIIKNIDKHGFAGRENHPPTDGSLNGHTIRITDYGDATGKYGVTSGLGAPRYQAVRGKVLTGIHKGRHFEFINHELKHPEGMQEEVEQVDEISTELISRARDIANKKATAADSRADDVEREIHASQAGRFNKVLKRRKIAAQLSRVSAAKARKFVAQG